MPVSFSDVVAFTLPGGTAGGLGAVVTMVVQEGRLYQVRCTQPIRIAHGARQVMALEDLEIQPDAPLVEWRAVSGQVSIAASGSGDRYAWLVPVVEEHR